MALKIVHNITDELLKQAVDLDRSVFRSGDVGDFKKCKKWLEINKDIYTFLLSNDKVVGYINFMPITDDCYEKFKTGRYKDYMMTTDDVLDFKIGKENKCLMMSIAIDEKFRDGFTLQLLWDGFQQKIVSLKKLGVQFSSVIMDCITPIGEKCAIRCMKANYICDSIGGKIYEGWLINDGRIF